MHDAVSCVPTAQHQRALRQISMMQRQLVRCYQPRLPRPIVSPDDCTAPRCILCVKKAVVLSCSSSSSAASLSCSGLVSEIPLQARGLFPSHAQLRDGTHLCRGSHLLHQVVFPCHVTLQPHGLSSKIVNFILSDDAWCHWAQL